MQKIGERFHGLSILIYFVIGFAGLILSAHPILSACSFALLIAVEMIDTGFVRTLKTLRFGLSVGILIVLINLLVNRRGPTILWRWDDFYITKESLFSGLQMAFLLLCCMRLFLQFSRRMTDEKVMALLAGRLPGVALLFCMILRLVPDVRRKALRLKKLHGRGSRIWRTLVTMTLEDGVIRSISMRDRGYERADRRNSFYRRHLCVRDYILIIGSIVWLGGMIYLKSSGVVSARFFPTISLHSLPWIVIVVWCVFYGAFILLWGREVIAWRISKQRDINTPMKGANVLR